MSGLAVLSPGVADTCPACRCDHASLDEFWACPEPGLDGRPHGHQLKFSYHDGDLDVYRCPAHRCKHTRTAPPKPRSPSKGDPMTAIATRPSTAVDTMWARGKHLSAILPDHIDVKAFGGTAAAALYADAQLMAAAEANPESFITTLMQCAALGHNPGSKEYALTWRKIKGKPTVTGLETYYGIVERMFRSGAVATIIVREVCAKDEFDFVEGRDQVPVHKIAGQNGGGTGAAFFGAMGSADRGEMVGVYAYARLITGAVSRVVLLTKDDVMAAKASSDAGDSEYSPWNRPDGGPEHPEFTGRSMWWKTAAKRLEPWVPTSAEYRNAEARAAAQGAPHRAAQPAAPDSEGRAANGRQALPQARQDTGELKAAIKVHLERLGIVEGDEQDENVRNLTAEDDLTTLTGDDLAKVLSTLESCDQVGELYEITGAAS